jgi:hypothetical protein
MEKLQAPSSQAPENIQIPSSKRRCDLWCLMFGASLELGCWSLELLKVQPFSIGAATLLPHSVQEPS